MLILLNLTSVFVWASTAPVVDLSSDDDSTPTILAHSDPAPQPLERSAACLAVVACLSQYVTLLDGLVADKRWALVYLIAIYSLGVLMIIFLKPQSAGRWVVVDSLTGSSSVKACWSLLAMCFLWSILVGVVDPSRPRTVTEIDPSVDVAVPPPVLLLLGVLCAAGGAWVRIPVPAFLTRVFPTVPTSSMQTVVTNATTLGCFLLLKSVYDRHALGRVTLLLLRKLMGPFCNAMASLHGVCEDLHNLVKAAGTRKKWKIPSILMLAHLVTAMLFIGRDAELSEIWKYSAKIYHMALDNVEVEMIAKPGEFARKLISEAEIEEKLVSNEIESVEVGSVARENVSQTTTVHRAEVALHEDKVNVVQK